MLICKFVHSRAMGILDV